MSESDVDGVEERSPAPKRRRQTRKLTALIFVNLNSDGTVGACRLGCLNREGNDFHTYSIASTSSVIRHLLAKHPAMHAMFHRALNNEFNVNELETEIEKAEMKARERIAKMHRHSISFFAKIDKRLDNKVASNLELLLWAIANGVPRLALNCPIFDSYHRRIGSVPADNRQTLQSEYLPQLDILVKAHYSDMFKRSRSVSILSDGWRDSVKRNWIDVGIAFVAEDEASSKWIIEVVDADLVPVTGAGTGDVLETLVRESVQDFVPPDCLIATSTNDGAGDERKAAFQLVQPGNDIWCAAHRIQLAIDDCLDNKRAHPPEDCAPHRAVVKKAHDLVVYIHSHRAPLQRFQALSSHKRLTEEGAKAWEQLVLDNDTRWDTDLMLLERVVYFDTEIQALYVDGDASVPLDCILDRDEFDLAHGMTLILGHFREFTKFVQYRNEVTLAYLPGKLDSLLTAIAPGQFDGLLRGRSPSIFPQLRAFQERLIASVKLRFADIFDGSSLALAARYLLPGGDLFQFAHFDVSDETLNRVCENMLDDFEALLPSILPVDQRVAHRGIAAAVLPLARHLLDHLPADEEPLSWWPSQSVLSVLFPLAKMLFAIPASSADNERAFSSASYTLGRRTRIDIANFRSEHRLRRFLVASTVGPSQEGRQIRLNRVRLLLDRFAQMIGERVAPENGV